MDDTDKSVGWFKRLISVRGFKASVITGGLTGILCGVVSAAALFWFEMMRLEAMSLFPFGGLLADGFGIGFWRILAAGAAGCVLVGVVGGGVAVAVAVRGGNELRSPKKAGMAGGAVGGILVFLLALLGLCGWNFRFMFEMFGIMMIMLISIPFYLLGGTK